MPNNYDHVLNQHDTVELSLSIIRYTTRIAVDKMSPFINVITVIILFLAILTIYSTSYNIQKEFFSGKTEKETESQPLSLNEFPFLLNIVMDKFLNIEKSHRSFYQYFNGVHERGSTNISQAPLFLGWSNQDNNTSPSGDKCLKNNFSSF